MLHERAMLVKLNISQWTGRKKDKKITRETNSFYGASPTSGYYSKSLIEKDAVKSILYKFGITGISDEIKLYGNLE